MKENDELFDMDEELTRSLERLVEEETNVAKAYVERSEAVSSSSKQEAYRKPANSQMGTTQMFDSRDVVKKASSYSSDDIEDESEEELFLGNDFDEQSDNDKRQHTQHRQVSPYAGRNLEEQVTIKKNDTEAAKRKNIIIIASIVSFVVVVIAIIAIVAVSGNNKNKKSYSYNYELGMQYYNDNNYTEALTYLENALNTSEGRKDTKLMYIVYGCYDNTNEQDKAEKMLNEILLYDKNNEQALKTLAQRYYEQENGQALAKLIDKYKNTAGEKHLADYVVQPPSVSEKEGSFTDVISLKLFTQDDCTIYYTTDGSNPTVSSAKFEDVVELSQKENTVKAIAVNKLGIVSEVAEYKYEINYTQPDAPQFNIAAGSISTDDIIKITNLQDGDKAYYTLDGTTPTKDSSEYKADGIRLNAGDVTVSVIIINKNEISSKISRNSYVVKEVKIYSFDEAVDLLKTRMKALNIIQSDGITASNGGTVSFVQTSKQIINDVEMYCINCYITLNGTTSTEGYYGVGLKNGQCYKVTESSGVYSAVKY